MQLIIESINFDSSTIQLLIEGTINNADRPHLIAYLNNCQKIGLNDINLRYQNSLPIQSLNTLKEIADSTGVKMSAVQQEDTDKNWPGKAIRLEFKNFGRQDSPDDHNVEYCMSFFNLETVLEKINSAISLIGKSLNFSDRILARLQLCIYELTVNSVEHGNFNSRKPVINLVIASNSTHVTVCYKDNANTFLTKRNQAIDIGKQIKTKSTRGLGLFIMNRLSQDFVYKRIGNWNVTLFKIEKKWTGLVQNPGRNEMDSFSIKLVMCDLENSMIIQPIGAIDSSTTQNMEDHFKSLLKDHKQYIIVDFSQVTFISSSGIGILLGTVSSLREQGGDLIFMKVPAQIGEIFDILNITDYFVTVDSVEDLAGVIPAQ